LKSIFGHLTDAEAQNVLVEANWNDETAVDFVFAK
jgi:hypothetical protein